MLSNIDWIVLFGTLFCIVGYGMWKTRLQSSLNQYLLGGNEASWFTVGLSVMATQASAITFISTPGQAYHDGLGFVQFYFGLPIAMIIICLFFIPLYKSLKVYTAYEYLEQRFDKKTRTFTAILFLIQRGLAAGITIYAPSIILSSIFGWNLSLTITLTGLLVIIYTLTGGTKAVSVTQKLQMGVIFLGLIIAFMSALHFIINSVGLDGAWDIAKSANKTSVLDFSFDLENRYTVWSGLIGGTFLALSYFGTDQSQVQRYLSSRSTSESQKGLIMNGLLKIPMQFFILAIGVMVFIVLRVDKSPIFFNTTVVNEAHSTQYSAELAALELSYAENFNSSSEEDKKQIKQEYKSVLQKALPQAELNDKDYVFLYYILNYLPKGVIGLLLAMIFCAAMSSTASELNALASTSAIDLVRSFTEHRFDDGQMVTISKILTLAWGLIAIAFACYGTLFENLIQFVNIIGSIFYGTILGVFVAGFFIDYIKSRAIFTAAIVAECSIIFLWWIDFVPFLWLNLIGCILTVILALAFQSLLPKTYKAKT